MDGVCSSFVPFCGDAPPAGVALAHRSTLLPHLQMPSLKIGSHGIVEDGLRESALRTSRTHPCGVPSGSGGRVRADPYLHSKESLPFAASDSSRYIPSGKSAHSPDPPLQFRTKFEASTQVCGPHTRTVEVPLASSAVWSQANALMIEGLGVCSVPSFPKAELSSGKMGSSSPMAPYSAPMQTALGFSVDSFVHSSLLDGNRVWVCGWSLCSHRPFSRKDRAVAHVASVHTETKIYSCGGTCGNPKCPASFVSKDNLHAHIYPVYTQCSSCFLSLLKKNLRRHTKSCRGHSRSSRE